MLRCAALFLVAVLAMSQQASAQVVRITMPVPMKVCGPFSCQQKMGEGVGSGVIIGRSVNASGDSTYRVLTVYHLTGNKPNQLLRRNHNYGLVVHTRAGRFPAKIISYQNEMLLMLLSIEVPAGAPELPALPVAESLPCAGDAVTIHGFSHVRNCEYGMRSVELRTVDPNLFTITSPFQQGESGGPLVKDGQIVGLCEGYYADSKIGFGPSVIAIRRFLDLPAIGSRVAGSESKGMPVRPGMPMSGGNVPVPSQPVGSGEVSDGQRILVPAPVHPQSQLPGRGGPEPSSTEVPQSERSPLEAETSRPAAGSSSTAQSNGPIPSAVVANAGKAAAFGLDFWSALAGAGIVAGTGGIGGLALLAWRGFKAGRAVAGVIRRRHVAPIANPIAAQPVAVVSTQTPPLPQQVVNTTSFVPYETHLHQQAYEWAKNQLANKWPGSIESFPALDSLIEQYITAQMKAK